MFKDELRIRLQESGNEYTDLARKLKITTMEVHLWLRGEKEPPKGERRRILAAALSVSTGIKKDTFGYRLKQWREKNNMTLKDVYNLTGIHRSELSQFENHLKFPSEKQLKKLENTLTKSYKVGTSGWLLLLNRQWKGYSQRQLSKLVSVTECTISDYETGKVEMSEQRKIEFGKVLSCEL